MSKLPSYTLSFLCLALAFTMFITDESSSKLAQQKGALLEEELNNKYLDNDIRMLKNDVYNLYHKPETVEKYARELYAYSKPDEQVVFFEN